MGLLEAANTPDLLIFLVNRLAITIPLRLFIDGVNASTMFPYSATMTLFPNHTFGANEGMRGG